MTVVECGFLRGLEQHSQFPHELQPPDLSIDATKSAWSPLPHKIVEPGDVHSCFRIVASTADCSALSVIWAPADCTAASITVGCCMLMAVMSGFCIA